MTLAFTDIADASAANGRLVIIANDAAGNNCTSSPTFASFSGNYAAFQNLTLTSGVTKDTDIPYVGSTAVNLSGGSFTATPTVQLYRMLAQINLINNTFSITGGPSRNAINLYNTGNMYFGTPNSYDGTGTVATASGRYKAAATPGNNANTNTWFVGENIQTTAIDSIEKTWSDAKVYCAQLQAIYSKWQDIKEYSSGAYYSAFYAGYYWNSSEYNASNAKLVHFGTGLIYYNDKTNTYRVRCVRDLD